MAAVWFRKPVACSTCSDCTGCILKDYRTYRLDAVCTNGKHAGSNLYCTGSEIHCTGKQCNEWNCSILSRWLAAHCCSSSDGIRCYGSSKLLYQTIKDQKTGRSIN